MKVAVCISGLPRCVDITFPSFEENIIKPYKPDIFTFFWNWDCNNSTSYDEDVKAANALYKPKVLATQTCLSVASYLEQWDYPSKVKEYLIKNRRGRAVCMFDAIGKANELRQYFNVKYDVVIRYRTDLFTGPLDIKFVDGVVIPIREVRWTRAKLNKRLRESMDDVMAWGSSEAMDHYSSLYDNYYNVAAGAHKLDNKWWSSHQMLDCHLRSKNVTTFPIKMGSDFDLVDREVRWKKLL